MKNIKLRIGLLLGFLTFAGALALNPTPAFAAAKTWTGTAGDHKFSTSGNWSPSGAPTNGDTLTFNVSATDKEPENDISSLSVAGITFTGTTGDQSYTISGNAFTSTGGITSDVTGYFTATISAAVAFSGSQTLSVGTDDTLYMTGAVSGSGNITKSGNGRLGLLGNNSTYSGTVAHNAGVLQIDDGNSLGTSGAGTTVASGATLEICYSSDFTSAEPLTIGGTGMAAQGAFYIAGCGGLSQIGARATWSGNIALSANTTVAGLNGNKLKITGELSGAYTLTIPDGQDAILEVEASSNTSNTVNGTYTAGVKTTTIAAGDNDANASVAVLTNNIYVINGVRGNTTVYTGGTLMGTGTVGDLLVQIDGVLAPGTSPGCLTSSGLGAGGDFEVELGGTTACTEYDQMIVNGVVSITGTLVTSLINDFKPSKDQVFTIINNDSNDAVSGTFVDLAEGATFEVDGYVLRVSYVGGDGNDVTLTVVSVPAVPDTGFKLVTGNPILVLALGIVAAGTIFMVSRKLFAR